MKRAKLDKVEGIFKKVLINPNERSRYETASPYHDSVYHSRIC